MSQLSPILPDVDPISPPLAEEVTAAAAELNTLLSRCSELSQDLVRMHDLLERIAHNVARSSVGKVRRGYQSDNLSKSSDYRRRWTVQSTFRRIAEKSGGRTPVCSELARACRIALIETNEPAAVETIYDRIQRRGSFSFAGYKHPFRAIMLALSAMVKHGEATVFSEAGRRRWRWKTEGIQFERPA